MIEPLLADHIAQAHHKLALDYTAMNIDIVMNIEQAQNIELAAHIVRLGYSHALFHNSFAQKVHTSHHSHNSHHSVNYIVYLN